MEFDVEQRDLVALSGALAGGDQLAAIVAGADGQDVDVLADDGAWAREACVLVEGGLEACELLVFVVAVDGDLVD